MNKAWAGFIQADLFDCFLCLRVGLGLFYYLLLALPHLIFAQIDYTDTI